MATRQTLTTVLRKSTVLSASQFLPSYKYLQNTPTSTLCIIISLLPVLRVFASLVLQSNTTAELLARLSRCCSHPHSAARTSGTSAKSRSIEFIHLSSMTGVGGVPDMQEAAQRVDRASPAVTNPASAEDQGQQLSREGAEKVAARVLREGGAKGRRRGKKKRSKRTSAVTGRRKDRTNATATSSLREQEEPQRTAGHAPSSAPAMSAAAVPAGAGERGMQGSKETQEGESRGTGSGNGTAEACGASEEAQRSTALQWVAERGSELQGVVYFMEEGNAHTLRVSGTE